MATTVTTGATFDVGPHDTLTLSTGGRGTIVFTSLSGKIVNNQPLSVQNGTFGPFGVPGSITLTMTSGSCDYTVNSYSLTSTQVAATQALVSGAGIYSNLLAVGANPPKTYERSVRFKRSALSAAIANFVAVVDLNASGVQARILPDGSNINVRDANGATLPFYLNRRKSIAYGGAGYCWFSNPRAIYWTASNGDKYTIFAYVKGKSEGGTGTAATCIGRLNHQTNAIDEFVLNPALVLDDHNHSGLWIRPDGRIVAMYADHNADSLLRWRVSTNAIDGDFSQWAAESTFAASGLVTYANPVYLSDSGRLYCFFRLAWASWAYVVSTDQGVTFGGQVTYMSKSSVQMYEVMRSTGGNRIDFIAILRNEITFRV